MADKLNEFAKQFNKGAPGAPKGLGLGVKLLAAAGAAFYGLQQSVYTGKFSQIFPKNHLMKVIISIFSSHVDL